MKSTLSEWLKAQGTRMVSDRGLELPAVFTDPIEEYGRIHESTGIMDLSFRTQLRLTGEDRLDFLQGMLSNDVKALNSGDGCHAALLNDQGRIVADLHVCVEESAVYLDVDRRIKDKTIAALERFLIADDVEITDLTNEQVTIAIQGPMAARTLGNLGISPLPEADLQHIKSAVQGMPARLLRADHTGHNGYELQAAVSDIVPIWKLLREQSQVTPVGLTALNMLRIEAGIPWYGIDMDENRIVLEVGLPHCISYAKGCYLGQEVVERASARGRVNRTLAGLLLDGSGYQDLPKQGEKLFRDDKEVGWLTSVTTSPSLGQPIALGYVRREHSQPGTQLRIDSAGEGMIAQVTGLPFLR